MVVGQGFEGMKVGGLLETRTMLQVMPVFVLLMPQSALLLGWM